MENIGNIGNIKTTFRNEKSIGGHSLDVLKSGLQKYVRRSHNIGSLYCSYQLDTFYLAGKEGERIRTNFFHRLMIIFLEDISIGGYRYWAEIDKNINMLFNERKKSQELRNRSIEINAIRNILALFLVSKKARIGSHLKTYASVEIEKNKSKIESENIYLQFTELLKTKNREAVIYATLIAEQNKVSYIFDELLKVIDEEHRHSITIAKNWYKEIKTKEQFLCWMVPLAVYIYGCEMKYEMKNNSANNWDDIEIMSFTFDDYVYDKHTRLSKNRTTEYFASVGAYVYPESQLIDFELKNLYEKVRGVITETVEAIDTKSLKPQEGTISEVKDEPKEAFQDTIKFSKLKIKIKIKNPLNESLPNPQPIHKLKINLKKDDIKKDDIKKDDIKKDDEEYVLESQYCQFVSRIQLTTAASRCDTYYGLKDNQLIFVKGPFKTTTPIDNYIEVQEFKRKYDISYIEGELVYLIPDRWPEGVPIGIRNSLDRSKAWPFLITNSIIPLSEIVFRTHSSKLWPDTQVIDPISTKLHVSVFKLTRKQLYEYFKQISVRLHFKISDLADRNFLVRGDCVYSIDEEIRNDMPLNLLNELKSTKYDYLKMMYKNVEKMLSLCDFDSHLKFLLDAEFL